MPPGATRPLEPGTSRSRRTRTTRWPSRRWASARTTVRERELASWTFGQTVGEALAGLDRMRSLYASLDDAAWERTIEEFRAWHAASGLIDDTRLDGTVTLTLVSGVVLDRS